jgi:hypothetical protein
MRKISVQIYVRLKRFWLVGWLILRALTLVDLNKVLHTHARAFILHP